MDLYISSPVTQVEEQPFSMEGRDGFYTGDWKGNRPEGYGEFIIGEYDYYTGQWYNGMLLGEGEMQKTYDDGSWKRFEGECAYNLPSGEGRMYIGSDNDPYFMEIEGDFGDESTLMYYTTDGVGKLVDLGGVQDGQYVSYVELTEIEGGIDFMDWVRMDSAEIANSWEGYEGVYIGQTDENGVPNGYGYSVSNRYSTTVRKLGTWKDGAIDGYYTEWRDTGKWKTRTGTVKDFKDVGDCVLYRDELNYSVVKKVNFDTSYTYTLCSDGIYRTDYVTQELFFNDGRYEYQKYITFKNDLDDYRYYYEGEYAISDADGNIIECGEADTTSVCSLKWMSYEEALKKELWNKIAPIVAIGIVIGVGAYALGTWGNDFENSAAGRYVQNTRDELARASEHNNLRRELLEKAGEEERLGNTYEANRLREEAERHNISVW